MTIMIERTYLGDLVKREADDFLSREKALIGSGEVLVLGEVVGKAIIGGATKAAASGNTGNGVLTLDATTPVLAHAQVGAYTVKCITAAANGGTFEVFDPYGSSLGIVAVGSTFANQIKFAIADGATDFVAGDSFTITVAEGSGEIAPIDFSALDGTQNAYGVAIQDYASGSLRSITFTSGGTYEISAGDIILGASSGASASVYATPTISSGTWAGGDAAGTLILENQEGEFEAETLDIGDNSDVATVAGNSSAYSFDRYGVVIVRDAVLDQSFLTWPTGATAAQITAALARLKAAGIVSDRPIA